MIVRKDGDGRQHLRRPTQGDDHQRHTDQRMATTTTTPKYSMLLSAAALQRAVAQHLAEDISARRARGQVPSRELYAQMVIAANAADLLDSLAAREGGLSA